MVSRHDEPPKEVVQLAVDVELSTTAKEETDGLSVSVSYRTFYLKKDWNGFHADDWIRVRPKARGFGYEWALCEGASVLV